MIQLRSYQQEALDAIHERLESANSTLAVLPTGTGKTILFAQLIQERLPLGRVMVVAHRKELIRQNAKKIEAVTGVRCGIEMAEERAGDGTMYGGEAIVVATVQTLASGTRIEKFDPTEFATLICDEAHHYTAPMFRAPITHFRRNRELKVLGLTATPDRADEAALGQIYETVAYNYVLWDAIMDGWLVPLKHWARTLVGLDLSKVKTVAGELNGAELAREIAANKNLEAIAAASVECAEERRTLLFADSKENAATLTALLNGHRRGEARLLIDDTPTEERDEIMHTFQHGGFQYLVNVGICTEGVDIPGIRCIALARPTKSRSLCAQMIGRGTRPADAIAVALNDLPNDLARREAIAASDKPNCLVIDFVDNTHRHDLVHPANILGGRFSDEVVTLANRAVENGKPADVMESLELAQVRHNEELIRAARDRGAVRAVIKSGADPFSTYGLTRRERYGWEQESPLDDKQREKLERWKIKGFDKLNSADAVQVIEEVQRRARNGLLTLNQERVLKRYGYLTTHMTFEKAHELMDALAANQWKPIRCKVVSA